MTRLLEQGEPEEPLPRICPTFAGTRREPDRRGSINGLNTRNFTPRHLIWAMLRGMTDELFAMYACVPEAERALAEGFWGGGNGLRKNPQLCKLMELRFGASMTLSSGWEEAACGAALFLLRCLEQ